MSAPVSHGDNRFNLLRLAAAVAVLLSHGEFLYRLTLPVPFPGHTLGSLAVYCFFFVSGYLVFQSWEREPALGVFWVKRVARIFPGLVVASAFSVCVVGWAMTRLPTTEYWTHPGRGSISSTMRQASRRCRCCPACSNQSFCPGGERLAVVDPL